MQFSLKGAENSGLKLIADPYQTPTLPLAFSLWGIHPVGILHLHVNKAALTHQICQTNGSERPAKVSSVTWWWTLRGRRVETAGACQVTALNRDWGWRRDTAHGRIMRGNQQRWCMEGAEIMKMRCTVKADKKQGAWVKPHDKSWVWTERFLCDVVQMKLNCLVWMLLLSQYSIHQYNHILAVLLDAVEHVFLYSAT